MKVLVSTILILVGLSLSTAFANPVDRDGRPSLKVASALNDIYPDLNVAVVDPVAEDIALGELESLLASFHGAPYKEKELVHLACDNPICGGPRGTK
jgi:hypothetical protein